VTDALSANADLAGSYVWASQDGRHGMLTIEAAEREGYVKVAEHPWYRGTWLMKRRDDGPQAPHDAA
jgi:hypothetical protein